MIDTPHLELRDLKGWYGEAQALHGVSLSILRGETVALLGRNGVGKSSTLRAIVGLLGKREGAVLVDGKDISRWPVHRIASSGLGYVPEERGIFSGLTVEENLMLPPRINDSGMSVDEIYRHFPNLKERRNSPGTKMSGGEQQMLAIARVLRAGSTILLLDEPMEGLAPVIVSRIRDMLNELKQAGMTILLVEQNFSFVRSLADRFLLMRDGQIVDDIAAADIARNSARIEEILGV